MSPVTMPRQRSLEEALQQKDWSSARLQEVRGTPDELDAYVQLQEAEEEVAARDRWSEWADGEDIVPPWPDFLPLHRLLG
jgi:hypothetical protein